MKTRGRRDLGGNWGMGGHWIRTKKRHQIYERDDYRCVWCNRDLRGTEDLSLDHVIPRARGGNQASNLVTACISCNSSRGETPAILWVMETQGLLVGALTLDRLIESMGRLLPGANKGTRSQPKATTDATE